MRNLFVTFRQKSKVFKAQKTHFGGICKPRHSLDRFSASLRKQVGRGNWLATPPLPPLMKDNFLKKNVFFYSFPKNVIILDTHKLPKINFSVVRSFQGAPFTEDTLHVFRWLTEWPNKWLEPQLECRLLKYAALRKAPSGIRRSGRTRRDWLVVAKLMINTQVCTIELHLITQILLLSTFALSCKPCQGPAATWWTWWHWFYLDLGCNMEEVRIKRGKCENEDAVTKLENSWPMYWLSQAYKWLSSILIWGDKYAGTFIHSFFWGKADKNCP